MPEDGMVEQEEQIALSHRMLDSMIDRGISLCDTGTGIGKTYAYLVANIVYQLNLKAVRISVSSNHPHFYRSCSFKHTRSAARRKWRSKKN